jgi:hypothetical protein
MARIETVRIRDDTGANRQTCQGLDTCTWHATSICPKFSVQSRCRVDVNNAVGLLSILILAYHQREEQGWMLILTGIPLRYMEECK